eukprot:PhF_6_TR23251/c0_g2_i1/m.32644
MVKFGVYLQSVIHQKPEWAKVFINYEVLNEMLSAIKLRHVASVGDISQCLSQKSRASSDGPSPAISPRHHSHHHHRSDPTAPNPDAGLPKIRRTHSMPNINEESAALLSDFEVVAVERAFHTSVGNVESLNDSTAISIMDAFHQHLEIEVEKVAAFADEVLSKCSQYFDSRRSSLSQKSTRRVIDYMRYVYQEISHVQAFLDINCVVARKLIKKFNNRVSSADGLDAAIIIDRLSTPITYANNLKVKVEMFIATEYTSGDVARAKQHISMYHVSPRQTFRLGFFLSLCLSCILYWVHVVYELGVPQHCIDRFWAHFPVFRVLLVIVTGMWFWGLALYVMRLQNINYVYILELHPVRRISHMEVFEISAVWSFITLLMIVLFLRSGSTASYYPSSDGFPDAQKWVCASLIIAFVVFCFYPIRRSFRDGSKTLFDGIFRMFLLPLGQVRFRDFFIADWATSTPTTMADICFTLCFFFNGMKMTPTCASSRGHYQYAIMLLPYYWRACQTIKMYLSTKKTVHLINTGKYCALFTAAFIQGIGDWSGTSTQTWMIVLAMIFKFGASTYALAWDYLMDWGWIKGSVRGKMFKSMWTYNTILAFDVFGRYYFFIDAFVTKPGLQNDNLALYLAASLEVARRGIWSILRIENENVNNLEMYRSVDFVPSALCLQEDEPAL